MCGHTCTHTCVVQVHGFRANRAGYIAQPELLSDLIAGQHIRCHVVRRPQKSDVNEKVE